MRASLISREVIADSIELVASGHLFDGLVCLVGCDKTIPAAVMALARLDIPGLVFYNGSIAAGRFEGRDVTIQDVFEAVGPAPRRNDERRAGARAGVGRLPGRGRLRRPVHGEHDGRSVIGLRPRGRSASRRRSGKADAPAAGGELVMRLGARTCAPPDPHPRGFENAIALRRLGRLHQRRPAPARDRARGRRRALDRRLRHDRRADADRRRPQAGRPLRRHRYVARRWRRARDARAGRGRDGRRLRRCGPLLSEVAERDARSARSTSSCAWEHPLKPTGGLAILRGTLSPDGGVVKLAGHERLRIVAPRESSTPRRRLRRGQGARDRAGRRDRDPLRGPRRGPGDARDAARNRRDRR